MHHFHHRWSVACAALFVGLAASSCRQDSELYCAADTDCADPELPYCDIDGTTEASGGIGHTCVPAPDVDADAGPGTDASTDAGPDAGADASTDAGVPDAGATPDAGPIDAAPVDATPDASVLYDLTVVLAGTGGGTVASSPAGIDCGASCVASFSAGTTVTLTATPAASSRFVDWSGGCTGTTPTCMVTLDAATTVTARFDAIRVIQVAAGGSHTCALLDTGAVRCWGAGSGGQLGYGNTDSIGDNETPASAGDVAVGGAVIQLATGALHTCALLDTGAVRCWGWGNNGQLGYGNSNNIGDDETPASAGDVPLGGTATQIAAGFVHTCALLDTGAVRCWGGNPFGQLGYGNTNTIGDDETPASAGDVAVGGTAVQITAGNDHTCAVLDTGAVRCWGFGTVGRLGYANTSSIGDDEAPSSAGDVDVGGAVTQIAAGGAHTCARLDTGTIRCWGIGSDGRLGYGNTNHIGDDETPASAGDVPVGGTVIHVAPGGPHTCARLDTGVLRCWGNGSGGQLGYGNTNHIGDDETPASAGDVPVGDTVTQVETGDNHTCAVLTTGTVRCWGLGTSGRLGYGNTDTIGDDETPASVGDVPVL